MKNIIIFSVFAFIAGWLSKSTIDNHTNINNTRNAPKGWLRADNDSTKIVEYDFTKPVVTISIKNLTYEVPKNFAICQKAIETNQLVQVITDKYGNETYELLPKTEENLKEVINNKYQ